MDKIELEYRLNKLTKLQKASLRVIHGNFEYECLSDFGFLWYYSSNGFLHFDINNKVEFICSPESISKINTKTGQITVNL